MERTPLLPLLIGLIFGLLGCYELHCTPNVWMASLMIVSSTIGCFYLHHRLRSIGYFILGIAIALWVVTGMKERMDELDSQIVSWRWRGEIRGKIVESDPKKIVLVDSNSSPTQKRYLLYRNRFDVLGSSERWLGQEVNCQVVLKPARRARVAGGWDQKLYLLASGYDGTGRVESCRINSQPSHIERIWREPFKKKAIELIQRVPASESRGVLISMLLGDSAYLTDQTQAAYRATGLTHLLVVSGSNLMLLGSAVYFLVACLVSIYTPLLKRFDRHVVASWAAFIIVAGYLLLVGEQAPILRAFYVFTLFLLSMTLKRPFTSLYALTLAALLLILWQPFYLFSASFQLTMSATFGILLGMRRMGHSWIAPWAKNFYHYLKQRTPNVLAVVLSRATTMLLTIFCVSFFAYLFTLPVILRQFHQASIWALPCNIILAPWIGWLVMPIGFFGLLAIPLNESLAQLFFNFAASLLDVVDHWINWWANLPGCQVTLASPNVIAVICWYGFWMVGLTGHGKRRWLWMIAMVGVISYLPMTWRSELTVNTLDVGDGLALVIELAEPLQPTQVILVDTGPPGQCERTLFSYLNHRGIRKIEALYLSHWDNDHAGCLEKLQNMYRLRNLYVSYAPKRKFGAKILGQGDEQTYGKNAALRLKVLHPPINLKSASDNNRSLVLRLDYSKDGQHFTGLLPGDIEKLIERRLINVWKSSRHRPLTFLLAPHHGSLTSNSREFVEALKPQHVIISRERLPGRGVVARYLASGAQVYNTRTLGTIKLSVTQSILKRKSPLSISGYTCDTQGKPYNGWGNCP